MAKLILIRDRRGLQGPAAERLLREHGIDYEVKFLNGKYHPTVPNLETPYGVYRGLEGIQEFLNMRISKRFKKEKEGT